MEMVAMKLGIGNDKCQHIIGANAKICGKPVRKIRKREANGKLVKVTYTKWCVAHTEES